MTGAQIIIECLKREGVSLVFAYPGATSMPLHQALLDSGIRVVLPRHEQGGAFAAEGYARATGRTGVCMATSGPGATNLITGIADACMDSIPLVVITAQVDNHFIGKNSFQETDIIGLTRPVVKHSFLVLNIQEVPEILRDAFAIASSGRPGPVVVDVPRNFLHEEQPAPIFPTTPNLRTLPQYGRIYPQQMRQCYQMLRHAKRPCLYAGGGILHAGAAGELQKFAETNHLPVITSLMGIGILPPEHPLACGWCGMCGIPLANRIARECDLLIAIGVRFSDRIFSQNSFAPNAKILQVEIDPSEINKNQPVDLALTGDAGEILRHWNRTYRHDATYKEWWKQIHLWKRTEIPAPGAFSKDKMLQGPQIIQILSQATHAQARVVTGVGLHQVWTARYYGFRYPRQFLCSGGLGAMGFGLPAAIGAQLARPDETVLLIDGDGSFQMNLQELATIRTENLPVKMLILDNQMLGMVAHWENLLYHGRHAHTDLSLPSFSKSYPDFCKIAEGYGIPSSYAENLRQLKQGIRKMLSAKGPYLLVARISHQNFDL